MSLTETRESLAEAIQSIGYTVYSFPREQMFAPAVVLIPASPYVGWDTMSRKYAKFSIGLMVTNNDNQAALRNLEEMIENLAEVLPTYAILSEFSQPSVAEIGSTEYLTSEISAQITIN
ncbi:MAG: hypothetical protein EBW87_01010 [Burkholderiaceae bacterium]|nr:hypothetical protein [Burkholderiaceae bacterium]